jgi:NitT/TauT family transport system substrate-binding protein
MIYRRIWYLVLVLFAFSCFFSGCERHDKQQDKSVPKITGNKYAVPESLFTLRFLPKWLPQAQFAGVYMAKEKGFYPSKGLNVEILTGGMNRLPHASLMDGTADVTSLFLLSALKSYYNGKPIVNIAQLSQKNATLIVGCKSSSLKSLNDLRGKKIGVWRDDSGDIAKIFLKEMGLDPELIILDWSVNLFSCNAIDAMNVMRYNEYHRILMTGLDEKDLLVIDPADYGFDIVDEGLYTTQNFYNQHKMQCQQFVKATMEGWVYAFNHKDETLDVVLRYQRENHQPANRNHQAWMLDTMEDVILCQPCYVGVLREQDYNRAQNLMLKHGLLTKPIDYKVFYPHAK